jgi:type II secretory pathway component PulC
MMRRAAILTAIFIAVTGAVHLGYKYLEQELQQMSCVPPPAAQSSPVAAQPVRKAAAQPKSAEPSAPQGQDFQVIVRRDIFQAGGGAAAMPPPEKTPEPEPASEAVPTRLNLTLAGTVIGSKETARAIVVNNSGDRKQHLLGIGSGVPETEAVIKSIEWNKVTLSVNGRLEELEMSKPKKKSSHSSRPSPALSRSRPARPPVRRAVNRRPPRPRPQRRISLSEALEQATDNPPDLEQNQESGLPESLNIDRQEPAELPVLGGEREMEELPFLEGGGPEPGPLLPPME